VLAAEAESWGSSLVGRLEVALTIAGGVVIGSAIVFVLVRRLLTMAGRRDQPPSRARSRARAAEMKADPELKVIIDLTDRHLEVMRERRQGSKLTG
jgi:hypothetical protein